MLRKVRTDENKESTQQFNATGSSRPQETSHTMTQTTETPKGPKWDKILNYLIGTLAVVVVFLIVSLIFRVNNSSDSEPADETTREVASDPSATRSYDGTEQAKPKTVRVEVLNGSGAPKMAAKAADFLRSRGFDVVSTGNAPNSNFKKSIVQDRIGNIQNAQRVAEALGVPETGIIQQKNPQLLLEVTVIIGQDYKSLRFLSPGQ